MNLSRNIQRKISKKIFFRSILYYNELERNVLPDTNTSKYF